MGRVLPRLTRCDHVLLQNLGKIIALQNSDFIMMVQSDIALSFHRNELTSKCVSSIRPFFFFFLFFFKAVLKLTPSGRNPTTGLLATGHFKDICCHS